MEAKLVFVLLLMEWLIIIQGDAANVLESNPPAVNGVLTACADEPISLTCSHDSILTATTRWIISPPVNCSTTVSHTPPVVAPPCGPFTFDGVDEALPGVTILNSTASATTADVSMTGSVVQCIAGNFISNFPVGNISLCIVDLAPGPITYKDTANGLVISWGAVIDDSFDACMNQVEYNVTITNDNDVVYTRTVGDNQINVGDMLPRGQSYNVSVSSSTVNGSCDGEPATATVVIPITEPTTQPPTTASEPTTTASTMTPSNTTSQQGPPIVVIVVPIIIVLFIIIILIVIAVVVFCICCRPGNNRGDQKAPLSAHAGEEEHNTESAPVYAMVDKSKKGVVDDIDLPTYQDPSTIQHEQAMTGDLYAVADKPKKSSKKEKSEAPLGDMYSVPDKSKKSQLTYAEIEMSGGSGRPVNAGPQTDYATVVN